MENNKSERPKFGKKLVLAIIIGTAIFVSVFLLAYAISSYKLQGIYAAQEEMRYNLLSFQIQKELVTDNCKNFDPSLFSTEMRKLGNLLDILEQRLGKNNEGVLEQKKMYALLETQHYLYIIGHNEKCAGNITPTILFFYSNKQEYSEKSRDLGYMLNYLWEKNESVLVYSFDYDLDSDVIKALKEKYQISMPNTLVINERPTINVFDNVSQIEALLR